MCSCWADFEGALCSSHKRDLSCTTARMSWGWDKQPDILQATVLQMGEQMPAPPDHTHCKARALLPSVSNTKHFLIVSVSDRLSDTGRAVKQQPAHWFLSQTAVISLPFYDSLEVFPLLLLPPMAGPPLDQGHTSSLSHTHTGEEMEALCRGSGACRGSTLAHWEPSRAILQAYSFSAISDPLSSITVMCTFPGMWRGNLLRKFWESSGN